jgi:hypothetical protein
LGKPYAPTEREINVERQGAVPAGQPKEDRFRFVELIVCEAGDRGTNVIGVGLQDFEGIALGMCFSPSSEVLADALSVQPTRDPENDFAGRVRKL